MSAPRITINNIFDVYSDGHWWPRHYLPAPAAGVQYEVLAPSQEVPQVPVGPADTGDGSTQQP